MKSTCLRPLYPGTAARIPPSSRTAKWRVRAQWGPDAPRGCTRRVSHCETRCRADVNFVRTQVQERPKPQEKEPKALKRKRLGRKQTMVGMPRSGLQVAMWGFGRNQAWPWRLEVLVQASDSWIGPLEVEWGAYHHHQNHRHLCLHQTEKQINRTNLP